MDEDGLQFLWWLCAAANHEARAGLRQEIPWHGDFRDFHGWDGSRQDQFIRFS